MAKKRTEQKTKSFSQAIGLQYIFNNTITDFFLGLALVTISVVTIIAMVSFLNTGAADQSILEEMRTGEWTNSEHQFQNYCGSLGAIISYWLISQNFGFPSFLLPTFFIIRQKEDMLSPGKKQLNMRGEWRQLANTLLLRRRSPLHLSTTPVSLMDISQAVLGTRPT